MHNNANYVQLTTSSIRFFSNPNGYDLRELEHLVSLAQDEKGAVGEDEKRVLANIFRRVDKDVRADKNILSKVQYYRLQLEIN